MAKNNSSAKRNFGKYLSWLFLVIVGILIGYFLPQMLATSQGQEKSYKTGRLEPRYLKSFVRTKQVYPAENLDVVRVSSSLVTAITYELNQAGKYASKYSWFPQIRNEHVFLYVKDVGNLRFTLDINAGKYSLSRGFDETKPPTLIVPIKREDVNGLMNFLASGNLSYDGLYRIYYVLAIPALQALYNTDPLYTPWDKTPMKFDDFVQIEIPPTKPVIYEGHPITIQATAVNVDGQWIVTPGLQGDPDFKLSLTLDQATDLYVEGIYNARDAKSIPQLLELSNKFLNFLNKVKVYERADHQ